MLIVQLAFGASVAVQLLLSVKSPVTEIPPMFMVASPPFVNVTDFAALVVFTTRLPKPSELGEMPATGATPAPLSEMPGAEPHVLLTNVSVPVRVPRVVGLKTMLTVQLALAGRLLPQLLVWLKSPLMFQPPIDSGAPPVLVKLTFWAALVVATRCEAKAREPAENEATGATPVPERLTVTGAPGSVPPTVRAPADDPGDVGVKVML